jgi:hypothetical protein
MPYPLATLPKGTLLYRGIDDIPQNIKNPMGTNSEGVLWTATHSTVAQTYIPDWGLTSYLQLKWDKSEQISPRHELAAMIATQLGTTFEILRREWEIKRYPNVKPHLVTNGTFGAPTAWKTHGPTTTWGDIKTFAESLGYTFQNDATEIKIGRKDGVEILVPKDSRLPGSLVILETQNDLRGINYLSRNGDLMDPDYHHAHKWAEQAQEKEQDFIQIRDYCQTKKHGNVGHTSFGITPRGTEKLKVIAILPAHHFEWDDHLTLSQTPEETLWQEHRKAA